MSDNEFKKSWTWYNYDEDTVRLTVKKHEKRIQNLKTVARQYFKTSPAESAEEQWVGMRPMMYDDLPVIDCAPRHRNLVIATGHGMTGISMAPSTGKLVTEIIVGRPPHLDPNPFSIKRF